MAPFHNTTGKRKTKIKVHVNGSDKKEPLNYLRWLEGRGNF